MPLYSYGAPLRFYARAGAAALVHCPGPVTTAPLGIECLQSFTADSWYSGELWWLGVSRCQDGSPTLGGMSLHADLKIWLSVWTFHYIVMNILKNVKMMNLFEFIVTWFSSYNAIDLDHLLAWVMVCYLTGAKPLLEHVRTYHSGNPRDWFFKNHSHKSMYISEIVWCWWLELTLKLPGHYFEYQFII